MSNITIGEEKIIWGPDGKTIINAVSCRRPSGFLVIKHDTPFSEARSNIGKMGEYQWRVVGETRQCPHCGAHFLSVQGSGHRRTFCYGCMRVTCGKPACHTCLPVSKKIELSGKGLEVQW